MKWAEVGISKDCGASALANACNMLGKDVPYHRIIELAKPQRHGVSLLTLKRAAEDIGLKACLLRTNHSGLCSLAKPIIVHLRWNHFDVISHCDTSVVTFTGPRLWTKIPFWLFKLEWRGVVMILSLK